MNADEQGNHHHHFGKGNQDTGNKDDRRHPDIAVRKGDNPGEDSILLTSTIHVNDGNRQHIGGDQKHQGGDQRRPAFLQAVIAPQSQRNVAPRAASARVGQPGIVATQTDAQIFIGTRGGALRVESLPELLNVQVDQRQDAQQYQTDEGKESDAGLQKGVVLHLY